MRDDLEIGRVVAVDTSQVTIELSGDLKALTRVTFERPLEIGQINSYVILPIAGRKIVAMVTRVKITQEIDLRDEGTTVTFPEARRRLYATLIGTIDGTEFTQGVSVFPVLDNPVLVATTVDLEAIFGVESTQSQDADEPGYCIPVGRSVVFPDYRVFIDPDAFFGKHAAIIGSTGSGKSCTIATVVQSVLAREEVKNARFIILDTNGEYRAAFQRQENIDEQSWTDEASEARFLYIPTDPDKPDQRLVIPYWFMNSEDFVRLFDAAPGIQRPVLLDSLRLARGEHDSQDEVSTVRSTIIRDLHEILSYVERTEKVTAEIEDLTNGLIKYMHNQQANMAGVYDEHQGLSYDLKEVAEIAGKRVDEPTKRRFSKVMPRNCKERCKHLLQTHLQSLLAVNPDGACALSSSADHPRYFGKEAYKRIHLEQAMRQDQAGGARARDYCGTMLMRIYRLLEDTRFTFLFGPLGQDWPDARHALAAFLGDILGLSGSTELSDAGTVSKDQLPFYDRQRNYEGHHNVVIIDLSLLAAEVLENVTALLGRLILELLQRLSDEKVSGIRRAEFPVVLVLEEAQNYIRQARGPHDESISREVFERIAREGRKYGLGLVVAASTV